MSRRWILASGLALAAAAALMLHTLFDPNGWSRRQKVQADLEELHAENARLEETVHKLRAEIKALRTRKEVQESVVRDELGFVKPDEVVVELGE